jgi:hypothetical protein
MKYRCRPILGIYEVLVDRHEYLAVEASVKPLLLMNGKVILISVLKRVSGRMWSGSG